MRVLTFSDLHGNAQVAQAIATIETPRFDAVVVAGDIDSFAIPASAVLAPLASFGCPVAYVYGNHDHKLMYDADLGLGHHLHGRPLVVDGYCLVGLSGCEAHWGLNPIAWEIKDEATHRLEADQAQKHRSARRLPTPPPPKRSAMRENIAAAAAAWRTTDVPAERTLFVAHERCYRLHEHIPGLASHVFGHRHAFHISSYLGTTFVNASDLTCGSWWLGMDEQERFRFAKADAYIGSYAVIEFTRSGVHVERMALHMPVEEKPTRVIMTQTWLEPIKPTF